jgi:hypothetical protein
MSSFLEFKQQSHRAMLERSHALIREVSGPARGDDFKAEHAMAEHDFEWPRVAAQIARMARREFLPLSAMLIQAVVTGRPVRKP